MQALVMVGLSDTCVMFSTKNYSYIRKTLKDMNTLLIITSVSTVKRKRGELCSVSYSLYCKLILESKITRSINRNLAFNC